MAYDRTSNQSEQYTLNLGARGRLVFPAPLRKLLGLKEGDRLVAKRDQNPDTVATYLTEQGLLDKAIALKKRGAFLVRKYLNRLVYKITLRLARVVQ